jgi:hypothetical protein
METLFYKRSVYPYLGETAPECFLQLDEYFDGQFATKEAWSADPFVGLAENLCRRLGDVDLYARLIADTLTGDGLGLLGQQKEVSLKGSLLVFPPGVQRESINSRGGFEVVGKAVIAGTLLTGHFGACKSVLDSSAIALNQIHRLGLSNKQQDFGKGDIWRALKQKNDLAHERYQRFRKSMDEIVVWRDASVHRSNPVVLVVVDNFDADLGSASIKLLLRPDINLGQLVVVKEPEHQWVDPLHFHEKWHRELVRICEEVCADIERQYGA